jgi:hypothetical protein
MTEQTDNVSDEQQAVRARVALESKGMNWSNLPDDNVRQ